MPKLSVIVPIFKTERYIEKCAESLLSQSFNDIEYIFINDCTPDASMSILANVIAKHKDRQKSIVTLDMPHNSGLAAVRKKGILCATGDYIIHCDSDDWVDTDLYEKMYSSAIENDADVVICPVKDECPAKTITRDWLEIGCNGKIIVQNWYKRSVSMFTVNKMVRRKILIDNNILPFDGVNMWEDNGLMLRVLYHSDKISQIHNSFYHYYRNNENAYSHYYGRNLIDQMILCAYKLDAFFKEKTDFNDFRQTTNAIKFFAKINLVTNKFEWLKEYHRLFPESDEVIKHINYRSFSIKGKIRFFCVKHHLEAIFVLLFKLKTIVSQK